MSTNIFTGSIGHNFNLDLELSLVRQDYENNRSLIHLGLWFRSNAYGNIYAGNGSRGFFIDGFAGGRKNASADFAIGTSSRKLIYAVDDWVYHNAEGVGNFTFVARADVNIGGIGACALSESINPPTIPRSSDIGVGYGTLSQSMNINISSKSGQFRHDLYANIGSQRYTIRKDVGGGVVNWTPPIEIGNDFPNDVRCHGNLQLETFYNGRRIGILYRDLWLDVPNDIVPTISDFEVIENSEKVKSVVGEHKIFVVAHSQPIINGLNATMGLNSPIVNYNVKIPEESYEDNFQNGNIQLPSFKLSGKHVVYIKARDSRGRESEVKSYTITQVTSYSPPSISISLERIKGNESRVNAFISYSITNIGGDLILNKPQFSIKYRHLETDSWIDTSIDPGIRPGDSYVVNREAILTDTFPQDRSYYVSASISDAFTRQNPVSYSARIKSISVVMSMDEHGIGIGKIREFGSIDVEGKIYSNDKPIQHYQITDDSGHSKLTPWIDVNTMIEPGQYWLSVSSSKNLPIYSTGLMEVIGGYTNSKEIFQRFTSVNGSLYIRYRHFNGSWDEWKPIYLPTEWSQMPDTNLNVKYKFQNGIFSIKLKDVRGNRGALGIGRIPLKYHPFPNEGCMLRISPWSTVDTKNLQINSDGGLVILNSGDFNYNTVVTWMV